MKPPLTPAPEPKLPNGVEPLLDREAAALFCACSPSHIDRLVRLGLPTCDLTLPGARRKTLRFEPGAIRRWTAERAQQNSGGDR